VRRQRARAAPGLLPPGPVRWCLPVYGDTVLPAASGSVR